MDFTKVKTYSLKTRKSKVERGDFSGIPAVNKSFLDFFNSLPRILKAKDLYDVVLSVDRAYRKGKPVIFMAGAHVIKCGLSPVVIDLLKRGIITCISLNGAGIIHDFEIACQGKTSEDVAASLNKGEFGMSHTTADFLNEAISEGVKKGLGVGGAVGKAMAESKLPYRHLSVIYQAYELKVPVTVHIAIGTDIIHQHPNFNAGLTGEGSLRDFRVLSRVVSRLNRGGVLLNFGSAVVLPEVFLKALNLARNLGCKVVDFTTVNFDMVYHYRPAENIVRRPVIAGGKGYYIIGHHEIMLPFLAQAVVEKIGK